MPENSQDSPDNRVEQYKAELERLGTFTPDEVEKLAYLKIKFDWRKKNEPKLAFTPNDPALDFPSEFNDSNLPGVVGKSSEKLESISPTQASESFLAKITKAIKDPEINRIGVVLTGLVGAIATMTVLHSNSETAALVAFVPAVAATVGGGALLAINRFANRTPQKNG